MNKKKKLSGIITLAIVAVLTLVIVIGIKYSKKQDDEATPTDSTVDTQEGDIDISSYDNKGDIIIQSASKILAPDGSVDGYIVTVSTKGHKDDIIMDVSFDKTGDTVTSLAINEQQESEGYGAGIIEDEFLSQFNGIAAPLYLNTIENPTTETDTNATTQDLTTEEPTTQDTIPTQDSSLFIDGKYEAETEKADDQGYINKVSLTIQDGIITEAIWDAYNEAGELKSVMSADGLYIMTETGLTWQEQSIALTEYIVANQSLDELNQDKDGKTDSISGVSISINEFVSLVEDCFKQAASTTGVVEEPTEEVTPTVAATNEDTLEATSEEPTNLEGTPIDAVSGATITSTAVVNGINVAQTFIKEFVLIQ